MKQFKPRYRVAKLRGGWGVEDTTTGGIRPGMVYAGAVALASHLNRHAKPEASR